jgi:hypothetical protein
MGAIPGAPAARPGSPKSGPPSVGEFGTRTGRVYGVNVRMLTAHTGAVAARTGFESVTTVWTGGGKRQPGQAVKTPTKPAAVRNAMAILEVNTLGSFRLMA